MTPAKIDCTITRIAYLCGCFILTEYYVAEIFLKTYKGEDAVIFT